MDLGNAFSSARPLLLIGCGRMGAALARGWLKHGLDPAALVVVDPAGPPQLADGVRHVATPGEAAPDLAPAAIMIAVKPQTITGVLGALPRFAGDRPLLVSIAAGVTLKRLAGALPRAVRAMPNTPAAIGRGITAAVAMPDLDGEGRALAAALLGAAGDFLWLEEEALLDAVTAVSGSGPAYVFALVEAMTWAGHVEGLPIKVAERLARQTVIGAAALLAESGLPAALLREQVTSPGGTTAAALDVLRGDDGLEPLICKTVVAAARRSRELGG